MNLCFSKRLMIMDYAVLFGLLFLFIWFSINEIDTGNLAMIMAAWVAQLGLSSGFYFWKAKSENLIKMPIGLLTEIPADMRERADPSAIIESVLSMRN